jgi:DNA primase
MSPAIMGAIPPQQQPAAAPILGTAALPQRHIALEHWQELVEGSAIAPAVAALSFRSFGDGFRDPEHERLALLVDAFDALNPQPGHSFWQRMKLQWRYGHLDDGGWRFIGDCLPGFEATHCWKPSNPRLSGGFGKAKAIKYETAPKRRPGLFLCQVPLEHWRAIAEAAGLAMPADTSMGFWAWVMATPDLPLVVVEGCKKAAALISHGIAAIGISGVWNGRIVERDGFGSRVSERLIEELQALAPGRAISFCFDADVKASTAATVELAAVKTGHLLAKAGATVRIAKLPLLNGQKCGPDDLLAAKGANALLAVLEQAQSLQECAWQRRYCQERKLQPAITVCTPKLWEAIEALPDAPIVGVRSAKGTGKTEGLAIWLKQEPQVLCLTHRISLGSSIANRLGLQWRNDLTQQFGLTELSNGEVIRGVPPRLALCIDSLLPLPIKALEGVVLVLDEAEQLLQHLLTSSTCRANRGLLFQRFCHVIGHAKQVVALDADLSDATLQLLQRARRLHGADDRLSLIANRQGPTRWLVQWWEQSKADAMQQAMVEAVGKAPQFITCDSKRRAELLHALLQHHYPDAKGILITSTTTATAEGAANVRKLTNEQELQGISWAIASPSISSGLSIEHSHFRGVWGFFGAGTFDDGEALQALARIRPAMPRHVWVGPRAKPKETPISKSFWPAGVEQDLRQRWLDQSARLRQELQPDLFTAPEGAAGELMAMAMEQWALLQSRRTYSLAHLRSFIKARLEHEGHIVQEQAEALPEAAAAEFKALKEQLAYQRDEAAAEAIAKAPTITKEQAAELQRRSFLLPEQQAAIQKQRLLERLALDAKALTPAEVQWGLQWAPAAKRLAMLLWPELALQADLQRFKGTSASGAALPFDQSFHAQTIKAAQVLGLDAFIRDVVIGLKEWSSSSPEVVAIADKARKHAPAMRQIFGLSISDKQSNAEVVGKLLRHFGIVTTCRRCKSNERRYAAEPAHIGKLACTANRLRQQALGGSTTTDGDSSPSHGGAPTQPAPTGHVQARPSRLAPCPNSASSPLRASSS